MTQHLTDIQNIVGIGFFNALATNGKTQLIKYGGANSNQCAGFKTGYKLLRRYHDEGDRAQFGAELTNTLNTMNINAAALVGLLRNQGLPRWANVIDAAPIAALGNLAQTQNDVADWLAGNALPDRDQMDVLMLVVGAAATPGVGVGSRIDYDPLKLATASGPRPPQVALFHELVHAMYNAQGEQLGREDSLSETNGGRLFELMAVGLPPFDHNAISENTLRAAWPGGVALRPSYP